jgi:putative restriction endonuclease
MTTSATFIDRFSKAMRQSTMLSRGTIPKTPTIDGFVRLSRPGCQLSTFSAFAPGRYQAMIPTFVAGWDAATLKARIAFGVPEQEALAPENALERRYALRAVKQRLHQASFREAVIAAYNGRCALSGLPEPLLLDAAHIVSDRDGRLGQPVVPNGIPLSKIHHAAFDTHLIGIDPDYRLHVSERLLIRPDGPMLEALKRLNGGTIHLPTRHRDRPDRDRLAQRFERFRAAA